MGVHSVTFPSSKGVSRLILIARYIIHFFKSISEINEMNNVW
jgi:hypothetical protein